jgi:hypothetical protein
LDLVGTLEIGDSMLIEETGVDLIVEILRTPHGSTL